MSGIRSPARPFRVSWERYLTLVHFTNRKNAFIYRLNGILALNHNILQSNYHRYDYMSIIVYKTRTGTKSERDWHIFTRWRWISVHSLQILFLCVCLSIIYSLLLTQSLACVYLHTYQWKRQYSDRYKIIWICFEHNVHDVWRYRILYHLIQILSCNGRSRKQYKHTLANYKILLSGL